MLEVTEHAVISDYAAFRAAVAGSGPDVQIAVDDAGAGFASLRHIVELRPHIVKIDRSLVAGIDADPARQALLAGLRHFADSQGCSLIAEGIETEAELATLVALDVRAGQGYLLGRPGAFAGPRSEPPPAGAPSQESATAAAPRAWSSSTRPSRKQAAVGPFPLRSTRWDGPNRKRPRRRSATPSETRMRPASPCDSSRLARLTVSPHRS